MRKRGTVRSCLEVGGDGVMGWEGSISVREVACAALISISFEEGDHGGETDAFTVLLHPAEDVAS